VRKDFVHNRWMQLVGSIFVGLVALEHLWFLILEMFLFRTPTGIEAFHMTQQTADTCAVLAQNQGLYNGFLAAGLVTSLAMHSAVLRRFCLMCVIVAGMYGASSLGDKAVFVGQSLPAALALLLSELGLRRASSPADPAQD
jgi:putative membrane protein